MQDRRAGGSRPGPEHLLADRDLSPARERQTFRAEHAGDGLAADAPLVLPRGKEHEPDGIAARLRQAGASAGELVGEKRVGNLRRYPGAVPRPAVRVHGSAVSHARESLHSERQDFRARAPRPADHEADAARVVLEGRIVETCLSLASLPVVHGRRLQFPGAWRDGSYK